MWQYEKKLQFPINIKNTNPTLASYIISQYGGPDGELAASLRYLSQRYSMTDDVCKGLLTDIGTEGPNSRKNKWAFSNYSSRYATSKGSPCHKSTKCPFSITLTCCKTAR